jgi:hypothetical protein
VHRNALIPVAATIVGATNGVGVSIGERALDCIGRPPAALTEQNRSGIMQSTSGAFAMAFEARIVVNPQSKGLKHVPHQNVTAILGAILGAKEHS